MGQSLHKDILNGKKRIPDHFRELMVEYNFWSQFYMVFPLVIIGTREGKEYDLAPKHMATTLGLGNYFGFICTPEHKTYQNIVRNKEFTVSFPRPTDVVFTSLAASPRCGEKEEKPIVHLLPSFLSKHMDALVLRDSYLFLECTLYKIVEGFGRYGLICGEVKHAYAEESMIRSDDMDNQQILYDNPLIAYLYPDRFAEIRETISFPFVKNMRK